MSTILPPRLTSLPAMGAGKTHALYQKTGNADLVLVPISSIVIPDHRERSPRADAIKAMKLSITNEGLLHPIGIKIVKETVPRSFRLVYGAVRLLSWSELYNEALDRLEAERENGNTSLKELEGEVGRWENIPAVVYDKVMPDDLCLEYELVENLDRVDLTQVERQQHAVKLGALREKRREAEQPVVEDGTEKNKSTNGTKNDKGTKSRGRPKDSKGWFAQWCEDSKTSKQTAINWWQSFCIATDRGNLTPGKASKADQAAWFAWLIMERANKVEAATQAAKEQEAIAARAKADEYEDMVLNGFQEFLAVAGIDRADALVIKLGSQVDAARDG